MATGRLYGIISVRVAVSKVMIIKLHSNGFLVLHDDTIGDVCTDWHRVNMIPLPSTSENHRNTSNATYT